MVNVNPTGRRIAQPPQKVREDIGLLTFDYLNQLIRDLELNFLDTQEVEIQTQTIVTSVNTQITVVAANIEVVSAAVTSIVSVANANKEAITSINSVVSAKCDQLSAVSTALISSVSVLNSRITSVNDTAGSFSAIIVNGGPGVGLGALITQNSVAFRLQDGRDLTL